MMRFGFAVLAAAVLLTGCAKSTEKPASTLTEAQRDSVLATEPIPGAPAIGAAFGAAAKEAKHAAAMDSLAR